LIKTQPKTTKNYPIVLVVANPPRESEARGDNRYRHIVEDCGKTIKKELVRENKDFINILTPRITGDVFPKSS